MGPEGYVEPDAFISLGLRSGFGNEYLKFLGVKLFADGSGSGGSAAVYTPQHRGTKGLGIFIIPPEKITEIIVKCHKAGLRTHTHAIGDRGIDAVLDAIERAQEEHPVADMRHMIAHCSCCTPKQMERIKRLGVVPCSSIGYMWGLGDDYIDNFGVERTRWLHPHKSYVDCRIIAGGNSDWPANVEDPIKGIYELVTRRTITGQEFDGRERVTLLQAIRVYTWNGAYVQKEENIKGSIEPGKLADMVILDRDILTVPEEEIKDIKVETTIVGGETMYQRGA